MNVKGRKIGYGNSSSGSGKSLTRRSRAEGELQGPIRVVYPIAGFLIIRVYVSKPPYTSTWDGLEVGALGVKDGIIVLISRHVRTSKGDDTEEGGLTRSFCTLETAEGLLGCTPEDVFEGHPFWEQKCVGARCQMTHANKYLPR